MIYCIVRVSYTYQCSPRYNFSKMSLIFFKAGQFIIVIVKSAIYLAKLIAVRFHKIRELIVTRDIVLEKFHTLENVDDMLTKLTKQKIEKKEMAYR